MIQKPYILALKSTVASLFVIALLWWAHKHLDARTVLESWQNVTAQGVLIVAMLILISHLLRVIRVFLAYKQRQAIQFIDVAGVSLTHNTISFLLPMRLGELALPILSRQKLNIPYLYSAATLLFIRLLDVHWLLLLVALSAANG